MAISVSAVQFWLSSLGLSCHLPTFLDNGYDDLEICRQVSSEAPTDYRSICCTHSRLVLVT